MVTEQIEEFDQTIWIASAFLTAYEPASANLSIELQSKHISPDVWHRVGRGYLIFRSNGGGQYRRDLPSNGPEGDPIELGDQPLSRFIEELQAQRAKSIGAANLFKPDSLPLNQAHFAVWLDHHIPTMWKDAPGGSGWQKLADTATEDFQSLRLTGRSTGAIVYVCHLAQQVSGPTGKALARFVLDLPNQSQIPNQDGLVDLVTGLLAPDVGLETVVNSIETLRVLGDSLRDQALEERSLFSFGTTMREATAVYAGAQVGSKYASLRSQSFGHDAEARLKQLSTVCDERLATAATSMYSWFGCHLGNERLHSYRMLAATERSTVGVEAAERLVSRWIDRMWLFPHFLREWLLTPPTPPT